ncbi:TIGR01777 family protein [Flavobacteriaceae bacterium R38]|nr:TIGR01777 family protein [Flavobacteriaceae bacterium R38]
MRILVTGATGLIGSEIVKLCHEKGFDVHYLTTNKNKIVDRENFKGFYWNPESGEIDKNCFKGVKGIINLAGASIAKRWTKKYKEEIINSRIKSTRLLNNSLRDDPSNTVESFVSASAIGIYPSSLTNYYDVETSEADPSFIGDVVTEWEEVIDELNSEKLSLAKIRIGIVLATGGGALPQIMKPVKYGLGAAFGNGLQWQSWIHIKDLAAMFLYVLENKMNGVYNGVAPNPVTNSKLTKEVASVLRRPLVLPNIPERVMKLVLGEMSYILFSSQRVSSKRIENLGFHFIYPSISKALKDLLVDKK